MKNRFAMKKVLHQLVLSVKCPAFALSPSRLGFDGFAVSGGNCQANSSELADDLL
jgi:hypothetical protein